MQEATALNWDNCKKCGSVFSTKLCLKKHIIKFHSPYASLKSSFPTNRKAKSLTTNKNGKATKKNKPKSPTFKGKFGGKNKPKSPPFKEKFGEKNKSASSDKMEFQDLVQTDGDGIISIQTETGDQFLLMSSSIDSYSIGSDQVTPVKGKNSYQETPNNPDDSCLGENGDVTLLKTFPKIEKEKGGRFRVRSRNSSSSNTSGLDTKSKAKEQIKVATSPFGKKSKPIDQIAVATSPFGKKSKVTEQIVVATSPFGKKSKAVEQIKVATSPLNKNDLKNILDSIQECSSSSKFGYVARRSIPFGQNLSENPNQDSSFEIEKFAPQAYKNSSFTFKMKNVSTDTENLDSL